MGLNFTWHSIEGRHSPRKLMQELGVSYTRDVVNSWDEVPPETYEIGEETHYRDVFAVTRCGEWTVICDLNATLSEPAGKFAALSAKLSTRVITCSVYDIAGVYSWFEYDDGNLVGAFHEENGERAREGMDDFFEDYLEDDVVFAEPILVYYRVAVAPYRLLFAQRSYDVFAEPTKASPTKKWFGFGLFGS